jgi:transcriptional regulator with XRE-family HTH domain
MKRLALIQARESRGLSRPQFARLMKGSRNFVHAVEMGRRDPSLEYMRRWVKALGEGASFDLFMARPKPKVRLKAAVERRDDAA